VAKNSIYKDYSYSCRNALMTILITGILLILYFLIINDLGLRARISESNLQTNLIRLHHYLTSSNQPKIVLVGSSMGGRLDSKYFSKEGLHVANLGLDGSRPMYSLDLLLHGEKLPKTILIEGNTIFWDYTGNDASISKAIISPTFKIGKWFPLLSPDARFSSIIFSTLKDLKEGKGKGMLVEYKEVGTGSPLPRPKLFDESADLIRKLKEKGVSLLMVIIPSGTRESDPTAIRSLASEIGIPLLEIRNFLPDHGNGLRYSDGMHLSDESAKEVVHALVAGMKHLGVLPDSPPATQAVQRRQ